MSTENAQQPNSNPSAGSAKLPVIRRALLSLVQNFRNWQREWDLYDIGQTIAKPKNIDDFVSDLEQSYVVDFKCGN